MPKSLAHLAAAHRAVEALLARFNHGFVDGSSRAFDMVVLASGMVPNTSGLKASANIPVTVDGFVNAPELKKGIYAVGTLKSPVDVARSAQDATGVVMKSIQSLRRG